MASNSSPMRCASSMAPRRPCASCARPCSRRPRARCSARRSRASSSSVYGAGALGDAPPSRAAASRGRRSAGSARWRASSRASARPKWPLVVARARAVEHVLAGPEQLHDAEREIGKAQRIGRAARGEELRRAPCESGLGGKRGAVLRRELDDAVPPLAARARRAGSPTDPAREDTARSRRCAAIMKSSIRSRARFFRVTARSTTLPSFATGVASIVSNSSAPARSRIRLSRLAAAVLQPELLARARVVRHRFVGAGPRPSSHAPTAS